MTMSQRATSKRATINTRFALGAPVLYVELVYFLRGGNSSFRGLGQYDTP
eukprot:COSAG02_NODE_8863_length_2417_cov_34.257981_3_plen_49_part_01